MAKKAIKHVTAPFRGFEAPAAPRELPAHGRPLFLPRLIAEAALKVEQLDPGRRDSAHEVFRKWARDLRAGVIAAQNEVQVEQDFYKGLLGALGYVTSAGVETGRPWSLQTKWHVAGAGTADAALGRFEKDDAGHLAGTPVVLVEVERAGKDLDRREAGSGRSPVQQVWDYLNAADEPARWAIVSNYDEIRLYSRIALERLPAPLPRHRPRRRAARHPAL
jgi:hypothetical protein